MSKQSVVREQGGCPECHSFGAEGGIMFDGAAVWHVCRRHKMKWCAPEVLTLAITAIKASGVVFGNEEKNALHLATYATVEPWRGEVETSATTYFKRKFNRMMGDKNSQSDATP